MTRGHGINTDHRGWNTVTVGQEKIHHLNLVWVKRVIFTIIMLLLLFVGVTSAVTPENIRIIQHQSAMVAEASLSQTMSRCMLK